MDRSGDWRRLCALLDDDEAVRQAVDEALESGDDPWEALLDGLDEAGALAFLRSDDTGMELSDALAQLPRVFAVQPDLDEVTDTDDLGEATAAADRILARSDLRIVRLVEEDDAWPVLVVLADNAGEIGSLVSDLGQQAVIGG
ncbi:DUF6630 family protein [Amnibacterium kyonggiense]|uniref:DUF6630 domain-containing protein n=1 Tax=Amnibacterium kyonggiense TaxID=595671 RepID=A0A4R7FFN8_9MICO|nr:hypothetical protein [Amnibacterium kyonggiense]TDS74973.1 hypothetical protein CLV52_3497 [Amnibacterium kyonggiense]